MRTNNVFNSSSCETLCMWMSTGPSFIFCIVCSTEENYSFWMAQNYKVTLVLIYWQEQIYISIYINNYWPCSALILGPTYVGYFKNVAFLCSLAFCQQSNRFWNTKTGAFGKLLLAWRFSDKPRVFKLVPFAWWDLLCAMFIYANLSPK